ncbi:hypothetical protein GCK32_001420 [Trichostrongylus colubriformis]|uniref:Uncharacterized protein n=1 Tax=Trichostrongylus colubriformis TaxID=6319 RepID=A0AAN8IG91_TRICO
MGSVLAEASINVATKRKRSALLVIKDIALLPNSGLVVTGRTSLDDKDFEHLCRAWENNVCGMKSEGIKSFAYHYCRKTCGTRTMYKEVAVVAL